MTPEPTSSAFIDALDHTDPENVDALAGYFAEAFRDEEMNGDDIAETARLAQQAGNPQARIVTERFAVKRILQKLLPTDLLQSLEHPREAA